MASYDYRLDDLARSDRCELGKDFGCVSSWMADKAIRCGICSTLALVAGLYPARVEEVLNFASMEVKLVCDAPSLNLVNCHAACLVCMTLYLLAGALFEYLGPSLVSVLAETEVVVHL